MYKEYLYDLIKSLSKGEKKLFSSRSIKKGQNKAYYSLYKAYEQAPNVSSIKLKLPAEGKNLSQLHKYLYHELLEELALNHKNSFPRFYLHFEFGKMDVLFERRLYDQARTYLYKLIKKAEAGEFYTMAIMLYNRLITLELEKGNAAALDTIAVRLNETIDLLKLSSQLELLLAKLQTVFRISSRDNLKKDLIDWEKLFQEDYIQNFEPTPSNRANIAYCQAISFFPERFFSKEKKLEIFNNILHSSPTIDDFFKALPFIRFNFIFEYVVILQNSGQYQEALQQLDELNNVHKKHIKLRNEVVGDLFIMNEIINCLFHLKDWNRLDIHIKEFSKHLQRKEIKRDYISLLGTYYNIGISELYLGHIDKAHQWIRNALELQVDILGDIKIYLRIVEVILHFEKENYDVVTSRARSLMRTLKSSPEGFPAEEYILKMIDRLINQHKRNRSELYKEALNGLKEFDQNKLSYFNFKGWFKSKSLNKRIMDVE